MALYDPDAPEDNESVVTSGCFWKHYADTWSIFHNFSVHGYDYHPHILFSFILYTTVGVLHRRDQENGKLLHDGGGHFDPYSKKNTVGCELH